MRCLKSDIRCSFSFVQVVDIREQVTKLVIYCFAQLDTVVLFIRLGQVTHSHIAHLLTCFLAFRDATCENDATQ